MLSCGPDMNPFAAITATLKLKAWLMFLNGAMLIALLAINSTDYYTSTPDRIQQLDGKH